MLNAFEILPPEKENQLTSQLANLKQSIMVIPLANQVETMAADFENLNHKVAVMGCVVNGPGEAKEADVGIAGGNGEGLLIKKGEVIRKVPEDQLLDTLRYELEHWGE